MSSPRTNQSNFGGDPVPDLWDLMFQSRILFIGCMEIGAVSSFRKVANVQDL